MTDTQSIVERVARAIDPGATCGSCPHFKSEPVWKQMLFFWRGFLWMGRCERGCHRGDLTWWAMDCANAKPVLNAKPVWKIDREGNIYLPERRVVLKAKSLSEKT